MCIMLMGLIGVLIALNNELADQRSDGYRLIPILLIELVKVTK